MTGHTGYITHARKILKLPPQSTAEHEQPLETEEEKEPTGEVAESA
jgi:hypothetical protein